MNRLEMKKRRLELMDEQSRLDKERCEQCNGELRRTSDGRIPPENFHCDCLAATRIREIGEELNQLSISRRKPPERLNVEAYRLLKDWEWDNQQIRKHYGISQQDFAFWLRSNGLMIRKPKTEEEPKMVAKQEKPELTVIEIENLRNLGESWELIGKRMGVTGVTAKNRYDRMKGEQPKPEKVVDLSPLHKRIEQLESENDKLRLDLLNKGQLKLNTDFEDRINELTKQLQRSKESYGELEVENKSLRDAAKDDRERIKRQDAAIQNLQAELEAAKPLTVDERERGEERYLELQFERNDLLTERNALQHQNAHLQDENAKLREQVRRLQDQLDYAREDQAAAEDYLCEKASHERKLTHALMDYIRGLEVGVK